MVKKELWLTEYRGTRHKSKKPHLFIASSRRTYLQKNPHTQIKNCTTHELVHELNITFTIPRNTTFDSFIFYKSNATTTQIP